MENRSERTLFSSVVYLAMVGSALICACINGMSLSDAMVRTCYALVIGGIFLMLLHGKEDYLWNQIQSKVAYLVLFAISVCLIGVSSRYSVGLFWMLLLVFVSALDAFEIKAVSLAMLITVYLCNSLMVHREIALIEYYLVMGIALMLVLSMIKKQQELPYAGVILGALCVALLILQNGFDFEQVWEKKYQMLLEISSLVFLLLFRVIVNMYLPQAVQEEEEAAPEEKKEPAQPVVKSEGMILMGFLQDDFVLMQQLKGQKDLYQHSYEISRISSLAAQEIGCDNTLASVGGMFHEVGRLADQSNYMEANMKLAERYQFPEKLQAVIRQHNTGSEVPKSPEAAVVMLSDCIISTAEYLERTGKRGAITNEKLVRNIFSNRVAKGSLDQSGLTEEQLEQLERFYIEHAFSG